MTFEIVCEKCQAILYTGFDLKSAKDVLKPLNGRCRNCGVQLSSSGFVVDVFPKR